MVPQCLTFCTKTNPDCNCLRNHSHGRYSLSPRRPFRDPAAPVPGPGAYDPSNPAHRPRNIAMGLRLASAPAGGSGGSGGGGGGPGPADYEVDAATTFIAQNTTHGGRPAAPRWTFGPRTGPAAGARGAGFCCMHGPGELVPAAGGGGGRRRRDPPGPGAYSPTDLTYPSSPRWAGTGWGCGWRGEGEERWE